MGAIAFEVTASLALKGALDHPALYAFVVIGYLASFALFGEALKRGLPLGVAYGVWGALGVAGTALLSSALFGERLTIATGLGMTLIIVGIVVLETGSHPPVDNPSTELASDGDPA